MHRLSSNVVVFAALKATEPYLDQYMSLDIESMIQSVGFEVPKQVESSPRHRTVVAHKL